MSNHIGLSNACYKSIVSTKNKKYLAKRKSMFLCGHAPWCGACPHTPHGAGHVRTHAPCISQQEITSRAILLSAYVYDYNNNIIIMCNGLVHDIFTHNI